MDTTNCVTNLINHYPDWEGAKVLQLLVLHPDTDIYATVVELCLESTIPPLEAQNLRYHLAPIKMTDEDTLRAIDKRLNQLIAQKANTPPHHHFITSSPHHSIDAEIAALTAYRKETTLPTGGIKCFNDEDTKAYRRQSAAISRLLAQATKDGHHEAVAIVKANLKKGKICAGMFETLGLLKYKDDRNMRMIETRRNQSSP